MADSRCWPLICNNNKYSRPTVGVYIHTHTVEEIRRDQGGHYTLIFFSLSLSLHPRPFISRFFPPLLLVVSSLTLRPRSVSITSLPVRAKSFFPQADEKERAIQYTQCTQNIPKRQSSLPSIALCVYIHEAKNINCCPYTFSWMCISSLMHQDNYNVHTSAFTSDTI